MLPIPGAAATPFVQICCKGPDRAGALEGYSGVVLKAWGVKVVVTVCSSGSSPSGGLLQRRSSAFPRFASTAHPAWWDGVSHVVTRPAREHVT